MLHLKTCTLLPQPRRVQTPRADKIERTITRGGVILMGDSSRLVERLSGCSDKLPDNTMIHLADRTVWLEENDFEPRQAAEISATDHLGRFCDLRTEILARHLDLERALDGIEIKFYPTETFSLLEFAEFLERWSPELQTSELINIYCNPIDALADLAPMLQAGGMLDQEFPLYDHPKHYWMGAAVSTVVQGKTIEPVQELYFRIYFTDANRRPFMPGDLAVYDDDVQQFERFLIPDAIQSEWYPRGWPL